MNRKQKVLKKSKVMKKCVLFLQAIREQKKTILVVQNNINHVTLAKNVNYHEKQTALKYIYLYIFLSIKPTRLAILVR